VNLKDVLNLAKTGRPDLAAVNLGISGCGIWRRPWRLLRVIARYPHASGTRLSAAYLILCYREGVNLRTDWEY
jgi:hypothetical protein